MCAKGISNVYLIAIFISSMGNIPLNETQYLNMRTQNLMLLWEDVQNECIEICNIEKDFLVMQQSCVQWCEASL